MIAKREICRTLGAALDGDGIEPDTGMNSSVKAPGDEVEAE